MSIQCTAEGGPCDGSTWPMPSPYAVIYLRVTEVPDEKTLLMKCEYRFVPFEDAHRYVYMGSWLDTHITLYQYEPKPSSLDATKTQSS